MHYQNFRKATALILAVIMTLALIPTASAAESAPALVILAVEPAAPGSITDVYLNEADGREIAAAQTAKSTEAKKPQAITGYIYESFSEELCCKGWMSNPLLNSRAAAPSVAV